MYCRDVPIWYHLQVVCHFATTFSQRLLASQGASSALHREMGSNLQVIFGVSILFLLELAVGEHKVLVVI